MPHEMATTWTHPKTSERERKASPPDGSRGQMVDGDRGEGGIEIEKLFDKFKVESFDAQGSLKKGGGEVK